MPRRLRDRRGAGLYENEGGFAEPSASWDSSRSPRQHGEPPPRSGAGGRGLPRHPTQRGFIDIQNYKQISVDAQAFLPRASFSQYVEAVRTETTVKVEQEGFLNIQLNDVIDEKAQLFYGRAAQTASLDRVLGP